MNCTAIIITSLISLSVIIIAKMILNTFKLLRKQDGVNEKMQNLEKRISNLENSTEKRINH